MTARRNVLETVEDCELIKRYLNREGIKLVVQLFIRFPLDNQQLHRIKANFMACRYAGLVGAVDGTHIQIIAPSKDDDVFVNRKKVHTSTRRLLLMQLLTFLMLQSGLQGLPMIRLGVTCRVTVAIPARRLDTLSQSTTGSTVKV
ncbi:hypothetical protein N1851_007542 [Merluccius polli]|uniref:DDE Tnp4 domain-containing protein n=1 Tax=Merluccius polli TaxID=89951 RepID=A0AA47P9I8_MERPO|nr:hypothetical protein N1851_007542 [Merluccius polli]